MQLLTLTHGSYPRIGSTAEQQLLRKTIAQQDRGEKTAADVRDAEDHLTMLALAEQQTAGIDIITDGLIRWYDPISHLASKLVGIRIGGLLRLFDTNFYFRQPVIAGAIARTKPLVVDEYRWAVQHTAHALKPVLTGPYTLARLSLLETGTLESAVAAYADALAAEVSDLASAGARFIQIDEPALLQFPGDELLARTAMARLAARKGKAELALALYFGDAAPLYKALLDWPVEVLMLDFTYSPTLPEVIRATGCGKQLAFGLLDGRNTRLEEAAPLLRSLETVLHGCDAIRAYLTTSCGLEYLPRDRAQRKLQHLTSLKQQFAGGVQ